MKKPENTPKRPKRNTTDIKRPRKNTTNIKNKPENFVKAIELIEYQGYSLFKALKELGLDTKLFYIWLDSEQFNAKRYARACQKRAEMIFEEMIDIADKQDADIYIDKDGNKKIDHNVIHRNKLQIDTRKWMLAKLHPKKYGDKIDVTSDGEKVSNVPQIVFTSKDKDAN